MLFFHQNIIAYVIVEFWQFFEKKVCGLRTLQFNIHDHMKHVNYWKMYSKICNLLYVVMFYVQYMINDIHSLLTCNVYVFFKIHVTNINDETKKVTLQIITLQTNA